LFNLNPFQSQAFKKILYFDVVSFDKHVNNLLFEAYNVNVNKVKKHSTCAQKLAGDRLNLPHKTKKYNEKNEK